MVWRIDKASTLAHGRGSGSEFNLQTKLSDGELESGAFYKRCKFRASPLSPAAEKGKMHTIGMHTCKKS